jgi:DNA-binding winged helix-turn-helix (wHTH) protein
MDRVEQSTAFTLGQWYVEPQLGRLSRGAEALRIDPRNMQVLQCLVARAGEVVSQAEIEEAVWGQVVVTPNSVYQSIAQLRRALGDDTNPRRYIETIAKKGYRLIATVQPPPRPAPTTAEAPPQAVPTTAEAPQPTARQRLRLAPQMALAWLIALTVVASSFAIHLQLNSVQQLAHPPAEPGPRQDSGSLHPFHESLSAARASAAKEPTYHAHLLTELGSHALRQGNTGEARALLEDALAVQRQLSGPSHSSLSRIHATLANVHLWNSDYAAAERCALEALRTLENGGSRLDPQRVLANRILGEIMLDTERYALAAKHLREAIELSNLLYGPAEPRTIRVRQSLALLHLMEGKLPEAEDLARQTAQDFMRLRGPEDLETLFFRATVATVLYERARYTEAAIEAQDVLRLLERTTRPDHPYVASVQHILGESLSKLGRSEEAERLLTSEMHLLKDSKAAPWRIARAASALGEALMEQQRYAEARAYLAYAIRELERTPGAAQKRALLRAQERMLRLSQMQVSERLTQVQTGSGE